MAISWRARRVSAQTSTPITTSYWNFPSPSAPPLAPLQLLPPLRGSPRQM